MSPAPERGTRLFFALWPGDRVRAELAEWTRALRELCGGRAPHPEDLHLTLAFLGSVTEGQVRMIERAVENIEPGPAALVLDRPGFWKHNRIAWAGASSLPVELDGLALALRDALVRSGIEFDAKRFVAHVTLLRDASDPGAMPVLNPVRWSVDGFVLAGSSARRSARRYDILRAWPVR